MTDTSAVTAADVINAASDTLLHIETGALTPADVERRAVESCKALFGVVGLGPADPLWSLHGDVTRQYLEAGGLSAEEIAEWLAVQRRREASATPDEPDTTPEGG